MMGGDGSEGWAEGGQEPWERNVAGKVASNEHQLS